MRRSQRKTRNSGLRFELLLIGAVAVCCPACDRGVQDQVLAVAPQDPSEAQPPVSAGPETPADLNAPLREGVDWPCFLGPLGDNVSPERGLLPVWPEGGPPQVWQREVGTGYSAPSVRGHRLVIHHRVKEKEIVECLYAETGQPLWSYGYGSRFQDPYGYNNGPRCSPLLTDAHCYTLGAEGKLLCLDLMSGQPVWERNLRDDFVIPEGFFGVGATPILEGDKLIVLVGGQPNSAVVAFDAATGKTLWQNAGQATWDGAETGWSGDPVYHWTGDEMAVSYSSPIAATIHGRRHVLCLLRQGLVSLDPETGAEYFHYWFRSRAHESVNAARPVVVDDTILLGAAYRVGSALLKVSEDGKSVQTLWREPDTLSTHWSTAVYHKGHYFGFSGRHENEALLQCVEARTGRVRWQTPGWEREADLERDASGTIIDRKTGKAIPWPLYGRGSAILADGKFIVLAERGTLALLVADSDRWQEISRCAAPHLSYPSWTAPVLSRGRLFLRDEDSLVCLDLADRSQSR